MPGNATQGGYILGNVTPGTSNHVQTKLLRFEHTMERHTSDQFTRKIHTRELHIRESPLPITQVVLKNKHGIAHWKRSPLESNVHSTITIHMFNLFS